MRPLTDSERKALVAMANQVGSEAERNQLFLDLDGCVVDNVVSDGSRLIFHIDGYERPPYRGQDTFRGKDQFPVEGMVLDADGGEMDVSLYAAYGRIYELELVRHAGGKVLGANWRSFRLK